jgi:hypothetical protein
MGTHVPQMNDWPSVRRPLASAVCSASAMVAAVINEKVDSQGMLGES